MNLSFINWGQAPPPPVTTVPAHPPAPASLPPMPALLGLPDAFQISSTRGELNPLPPITPALVRLPLIGPALSWTTPVIDTVSDWTGKLFDPVVSWTNRLFLKPIQTDPPRPASG